VMKVLDTTAGKSVSMTRVVRFMVNIGSLAKPTVVLT
jgi:hypothetical protein